MDTYYAQVLDLLDSHYAHIEAWCRIVYSYRVVTYCQYAESVIPSNLFELGGIMAFIDGWWAEKIRHENKQAK